MRRHAQRPTAESPAPPRRAAPTGRTERIVQRAAAAAGIHGVPVTAVTKPVQRSGSGGGAPATAEGAATPGTRTPSGSGGLDGVDVDELARRLFDPLSRLFRTEMRRGRERMGRLYDGQR
ncbi:hypothetical protein ACFVIM_23790 [Streptomyces sp. NPDC057638]|uniref:hypothetical protein n=1 Tax=Streptomyces sp. NPDC057638 TaxID=3346190 RepID=UPI00369F96D5